MNRTPLWQTPSSIGRLCLLLILWAAHFVPLHGLEPTAAEKHVFAIESGEATSTLPQVARQGNVDVMFAVGIAKGVRTNEVEGAYTPLEALEIMLANTPLQIVEDRETGAFAVVRVSGEVSSSSQPGPPSKQRESEPKPTPDMTNKKGLFSSLMSGVAAVLTFGDTPAQAQEDEEIVTLQAYEIFGAAQAASVERQKQSDIIGSYLSSDALSELPDDDLGEALSRLAGVNVIGGIGTDEASVTIRGAEGQYNTVRINGAAQANARLASRNFDVSQIPSEMVAGVEIIKSVTAEHPADSIGGSVNVETANAFSLGRKITRYKLEARNRDQGDLWGYGVNLVYADILDAFGGEDNLGMFFNINYVDEELVTWSTQNRFLDQTRRLRGSIDPDDDDFDPRLASLAEQTILEVNPNASIPIWDRFDPNEQRVTEEEITFSGSIDYLLSDDTRLYFRPWVQIFDQQRDAMAFRIDRLERAFDNNWYFLDDNGDPLGSWEDSDEDGVPGSEDDTFIQAVDSSGNLIVTPNFEANRDGRNSRIVQDRDQDGITYTLDFGGETRTENGFLEYRLLFSVDQVDDLRRQSRYEERFDDGRAGDRLRARIIDGSTPLPLFSVFEVTERRGHVPSNNRVNVFSDLDRLFINSSPRFQFEDISEDVLLASIDYDHQVNDWVFLKTGVRFRSAKRENVTTQLFYNAEAGSRRVFPVGQFAAESNAGNFTLFDGMYSDIAGPFVLADPIYDFFFEDLQSNPGNWVFDRSDLRDVADNAELNEDIRAAYMQTTMRWDNWTLVAGARIEDTKLDTTWKPSNFVVDGSNIPGLTDSQVELLNGLVQETVEDIGFTGPSGGFSFGDIVDDVNRKNEYTNFLPSAVLTYRAGNSGHVFRFAWTNTLTRPDYRELVPFDMGEANRQLQAAGVLNLTNREDEFDLGNPNLTEQTSENFDLAWEYYFGPQQRNMISVTAFKKDLEDFLQEDTFRREIEILIDPEDPSLGTEFVTSDTNFWSNASSRSIEGIEFTGYFQFDDLFPDFEWLHGLSFVPNYAYITGDQTDPIYDQDELADGNFVVIGERFTDSLTNQAEEVYNLQLFYERRRFNIRLSYNYISRLQRTPSTAAISAITFDREQENLDLSVQYRLHPEKDIRLFFEADNLNDGPKDERYIGPTSGLFTTSYETIGRRFVAGVRGSF